MNLTVDHYSVFSQGRNYDILVFPRYENAWAFYEDYAANPTHGLALFCHPNHKNVQYYLDELAKNDTDNTVEIRKCGSRPHVLFQNVHRCVCFAMNRQ